VIYESPHNTKSIKFWNRLGAPVTPNVATASGDECRLILVRFGYRYIVVAGPKIQRAEPGGTLDSIQAVVDQRKRVAIISRYSVQLLMVNAEPNRSILLSNENNVACAGLAVGSIMRCSLILATCLSMASRCLNGCRRRGRRIGRCSPVSIRHSTNGVRPMSYSPLEKMHSLSCRNILA